MLYQAAYTYDSNGNILSVTGTEPVTYTYDSMNQLTSETRNGVTTTYEYDNRGNLVKETKGAEVTNYTYTGDNRLTQVDKNGTITTYEYDLNGNLVGDSNGSFYGYDEENRLVYAKVDGVVSEYGISTEGLRVSKGVGNDYTYEESTAYTIDQDGNVILENGDDIIRGHQALAKRTEDGSYYYYIYNGHGDVVMLVDESGNVKNSYAYDAWGKITSETETIPNSIKYAGEYYDAETGFLYLRNRMYDPATRRFTSEDPARDELNWYVYCGNNPVIYVDPWGKTWKYFDMYLPQYAQDYLEKLTRDYYAAGDSLNEYGGYVRDDIHNEAVRYRMQFLDMNYLSQAIKDLKRVGLNTDDPNYNQRVYEWAMALQVTEQESGPIPRDDNGNMNNYVFNALLGGVKRDIAQVNSVANELNMTKQQRYDFGDYIEEYKASHGMPRDATLSYKQLLEIGKEFLGQ